MWLEPRTAQNESWTDVVALYLTFLEELIHDVQIHPEDYGPSVIAHERRVSTAAREAAKKARVLQGLRMLRIAVDDVQAPRHRLERGAHACNQLRNEVKEVLASKPLGVVLNLSQVVYMDSGGIGTMVALYTSAHAAGCELKIASPTDRVKYVLDITKLTPILGVFPSEERAFASMQRQASA